MPEFEERFKSATTVFEFMSAEDGMFVHELMFHQIEARDAKIASLQEQIDQQHNFHDILNNDLISASQKLKQAIELMKIQVSKYGTSNIMKPFIEFLEANDTRENNVEFIADTREDTPNLYDEIENLRRQLVTWIVKAGYDPTHSLNEWGKKLSDYM